MMHIRSVLLIATVCLATGCTGGSDSGVPDAYRYSGSSSEEPRGAQPLGGSQGSNAAEGGRTNAIAAPPEPPR